MTSNNSSGRSPFPARRTRIDEAQSPFLHGLLRFSPNNSAWSPRPSTSRATATAAKGFFDAAADSPLPTPPTNVQDGIPLDNLRALAQDSVFYASILYSKTNHPSDAVLLAKAQLNQPTACLRCLEESGVLQSDRPWPALVVACQALAAQHEWLAIAQLLEDACRISTSNQNTHPRFKEQEKPLEDKDDFGWHVLQESIDCKEPVHVLATLCLWRGIAYQETGHVVRAATYWKRALQIDCHCQPAWEALMERQLLTVEKAHDLVQAMEFSSSQKWLRAIYLASIEVAAPSSHSDDLAMQSLDASCIPLASPLHAPSTPMLDPKRQFPSATAAGAACRKIQLDVDGAFQKLSLEHKLESAPHVLALSARRAHRRYDWHEALEYCDRLASLDPHVTGASHCYLSTLVLLGQKQVLFRVAHEWVESAPKSSTSWLAVGCYYYACQRFHVAQRHFCRATRLDPNCTMAWMAFGCSFAACDESDQALASFRAAQRLSPGEHSSLLYMGMEYVRTNHLVLAQHFLHASLKACGGSDPLVLHELGVWCMNKEEWNEARAWFEKARGAVGDFNDSYWEPTLFNLGQCYRRLLQFDDAVEVFEKCVSLCPEKASTYGALGFTKHLMDDIDGAIDFYHQALSVKPDDPFCGEMLQRALQEQLPRPLAAPNMHSGAADESGLSSMEISDIHGSPP